jgi:hypothetical protein
MAPSTSTELLKRLDSGFYSYSSTRKVAVATSATNQNSFDEEISDEDRWSDLQLTALDSELETLEALLRSPETNVNAHQGGWYGQTALQVASFNGYAEIVTKLQAPK